MRDGKCEVLRMAVTPEGILVTTMAGDAEWFAEIVRALANPKRHHGIVVKNDHEVLLQLAHA